MNRVRLFSLILSAAAVVLIAAEEPVWQHQAHRELDRTGCPADSRAITLGQELWLPASPAAKPRTNARGWQHGPATLASVMTGVNDKRIQLTCPEILHLGGSTTAFQEPADSIAGSLGERTSDPRGGVKDAGSAATDIVRRRIQHRGLRRSGQLRQGRPHQPGQAS